MSSQAEVHDQEYLADDAACPGRDACSAEIERLRGELSALKQAKTTRLQWWLLCVFGIAALALLPLVTFCLGLQIAEFSVAEWLSWIFLGFYVATPVSQLAVIVSIAVLHAGPRWRRYLVACLVAAASLAVMTICSIVVDESEFGLWFVHLLPASVPIVILTLFAARVWARWTLIPAGQPRTPRAVGLSSYFFLIGAMAVCAAALQALELDETALAQLAITFAIYSALPAVTAGSVLMVFLSAILGRARSRWKTILVSAGMLLLTSTLGPLLMMVSLYALEGSFAIDSETMQAVLFYSLAMFVTVTVVLSLSVFWMRRLGYELVTIRDQPAVSAARAVELGRESLQPT